MNMDETLSLRIFVYIFERMKAAEAMYILYDESIFTGSFSHVILIAMTILFFPTNKTRR